MNARHKLGPWWSVLKGSIMRWLVTKKAANWWWLGRELAAGGSDSTESTPATSKTRRAPHGFRWLYSTPRLLWFCFMCWR